MKKPQKLLKKSTVADERRLFELSSKEHANKYNRGVPTLSYDKDIFITSYRTSIKGKIGPVKHFSFTPSVWKSIYAHLRCNEDKAISKIVQLNRKYYIESENIWLHLLVIVNYYVLKIPTMFDGKAEELNMLTRAFDVLMLLDGFEDLEYRNTKNSETSNFLIGVHKIYSASKERYFRNMRIFIEHNSAWRGYYDKQVLQLYFDKGLRLIEIAKLYRDNETGDIKPVSVAAVGAKINTYRKQMLKMMEKRPDLFEEEGLSKGYMSNNKKGK